MSTRMGARPWLARTQRDFAQMLSMRGGDDTNRERAAALAAQAESSAAKLGISALADKGRTGG